MKKILLTASLALISSLSFANSEQLNNQLKQQYPQYEFSNIQPTEMTGLYSASIEGNIVYLTQDGQYLISGNAIRLKDQSSISQELSLKAKRIEWNQLPFNDAIKTVKGNGKRQLAVFSDPNCPYCKKLEEELKKLDNVTIHTFIFAIKPQSVAPSKQVYCEKNPAYAWQQLIVNGVEPSSKKACSNPIERNIALAKRLGLNGTPAMVYANGSTVVGYQSAAEIEKNWKILGL